MREIVSRSVLSRKRQVPTARWRESPLGTLLSTQIMSAVGLGWPRAPRGFASLVLVSCACACQVRPASPAGPFLVGLPLAPYCRESACPRDYDDAVAHAFAGQPNRQVYPACRGARA